MGTYVGEIKISSKNGFFVNFYPGYKYVNGSFRYLTDSDLQELLPDSQFLNINLVSTSPSFRLEEHFQDGDDVIIDFTFNDLSANTKGSGELYATAWKLDVSRLYGSAIRRMEDLGYYCVLNARDVLSNWKEEPVVELDSPNINEGMMVMLPGGELNTLIGPYQVRYDEEDEMFYVRISADQKKALICGYTYEDGIKAHQLILEQEDVTRTYIPIEGEGIVPFAEDQITDEELVESFRQSLSSKMIRAFHLDPQNVDHMLNVYRNSLLTGYSLPEHVAANRCKRLKAMFTSQLRFSSTLDSIAAALPNLVRLYKDDPAYKELMASLAKDEDFVEQLGAYEDFVNLKNKMEREVETFSKRRDELAIALQELETINPEKRLELYRAEADRLIKMKEQAEEELREIHRQTNMGATILEMEERSAYLEEQINAKQEKIRHLDEQMENLQQKLDDILEESSKRSFEIAFDNMISERFMEHTARAENARRIDAYQSAARAMRSLPKSFLANDQLVDSLVHALKIRRPEYTRNEILNILICLFRGFLTIFSGAPGSGKTSICRIVAEVLNLEEPASLESQNPDFPYCARYVPVSVERGWTSRRDLIGFYNSLTRNFDKADPRLFDLLSILNQESRSVAYDTDLPALVLLDDANLSSMEYYWADFMTMEENARLRGTLSLGENYMLQIPRSLHFAASIQSDHTTEPLSSRLLDRAWVVTMPEKTLSLGAYTEGMDSSFASLMVTRSQLESVFSPASAGLDLPRALEDTFDDIRHLFEEAGLPVSIRSETAVRGYVLSAMRWFETDPEEPEIDAGTIALDYAVLQRLMPRISGSSERFRAVLEKMKKYFERTGLKKSAARMNEIMERGDGSMQFYQFFN